MSDKTDEPEGQGDDEALSWEGDNDVIRHDEDDAPDEPAAPRRRVLDVVREMSTPERVIAAVFAVVAVASSVGWAFVVAQNPVSFPGLFMTIMYEFGELLAIIAPTLIAFTVVQIARGRARTVWLAVMAVVTLPWPLLVEGVA